MKKFGLTFIGLLCLLSFLFAQDGEMLMSKKGALILPQSGDIALGVDAVPFFEFVGNMFNETSGNTISANFITDQAIVGKYFLSDKNAVRLGVRFGFYNDKNQNFIMKDALIPDPLLVVTDQEIRNVTNFDVSASYEWRRGHGRLQGFYGGSVNFKWNQSNTNYEYGNPITQEFSNPNTTDFGANILPTGRVTEYHNLTQLAFGVRGFIGVEYFFAPKISLGCEFGWGPYYQITANGKLSQERWNGSELELEVTDVAKDSRWGFDTDNAYGNLFLMFHF